MVNTKEFDDYILHGILTSNESKTPFDDIEGMFIFKSKELDYSDRMLNLALAINGNAPIHKYVFDLQLFSDWCKLNGLEFVKDELNRTFNIRKIK